MYLCDRMHDKFLTRCLALAQMARGRTSPNPLVGAVIVHNGLIIGEGYHAKAGEPHAEIRAIASVKDPSLLPHSTLYCSLEPCAHFGRTPPCSLRIVQERIPHVVIGCLDPHDKVAGKGVAILQQAGVRVELAADPRPFELLNKVFFTNILRQRPYVTLKWAQSADGYLDDERNGRSTAARISGPLAASRTHQLRAQHDALLVTGKTLNADRPSLTLRHWAGRAPRPIVLVGGRIRPQKDALSQLNNPLLIGLHLDDYPYETLAVDAYKPEEWLPLLLEKGLTSVLVEGGGTLHEALATNGWADAVVRYTAPHTLGSGPKAYDLKQTPSKQFWLGKDLYETF